MISYSDFKGNKLKLKINLISQNGNLFYDYVATDLINRKSNIATIAFPTFINLNLERNEQLSAQIFMIDSAVAPWTTSIKLVKEAQGMIIGKM